MRVAWSDTRAVSNWRFSTFHGLESRPLERGLGDNLAGPADWNRARTSVSPFASFEGGRYVDYLRPWCAALPDTTICCANSSAATSCGPPASAQTGDTLAR